MTKPKKEQGIDNAVMTGWQFTIMSQYAFHGQRVKAYFNDVRITDNTPEANPVVPPETIKRKEIVRTSKVNMLPGNTSFECSDENWNMVLDRTTQAAIGTASLKMPGDKSSVWSKPYYDILDGGKPYTYSFYARAAKKCRLTAGVFSFNLERLAYNDFNLDTQWRRFSLQVPADAVEKLIRHWSVKNKGFAKYGIMLLFKNKSPDTDIWLDAIQINPGSTPMPFEPGNNISAAVHTSPCSKGILPVSVGPVDLKIDLYNARKTSIKVTAELRVRDYYGHDVCRKTFEPELEPGKTYSTTIPVDISGRKGFFNAELNIYEQGKKICAVERSFVTTAKPAASSDHFMGIHPNTMQQHDINALDAVGVKAVRVFFHSWIAKCVDGKWQFPKGWDLKPYLEKDMMPLVSTMWEWKKTSEIDLQTQLKNYVEYCRQFVRKYGAYTRYWEIENEPNLTMPVKLGITREAAADFYAQVLREASAAIREIQPDAVISVGVSDGRDNILWYRTILKKAKDSFAVFALHPYSSLRLVSSENNDMGPETVTMKQRIEKVRELIREYNGGQQIWVGEIGWVLTCLEPVISDPARRHARFLVRTVLLAKAAGAKHVFYFIEEGVYERHGFAFGLWTGEMQPRPAVAAYATMAQIIGDSEFVGPIIENGTQYGYMFEKGGKPFAAVWQTENAQPTSIILKSGDGKFHLTDIMNNPLPVPGNGNGELVVPISPDPVFVFSDNLTKGQFSSLMTAAKWSIPPVQAELYPASNRKIVCRIDNNYKSTQSGVVSIASDKLKFTPSSQEFVINPGGNTFCGFSLPDDQTLAGNNSLKIDVKTGRGDIKKTTELSLYACSYKAVNLQLPFGEAVKGLTSTILDSRLFILPPDDFVEWKGPADLSVAAYTAWDESNFYFLADVTDDIHCQHQSVNKLWASDSIQIAFDTRANARASVFNYDDDDLEIDMALSDGKSLWNVGHAGASMLKNTGSPVVIVTRENNHTYYKCAVPWSRLNLTPQPGMAYGFNFIVNEDEGQGRSHFMGMTPGIGEKKYPYLFRKFYLAPRKSASD